MAKDQTNVSAIYSYEQMLIGNEKMMTAYFMEEKNTYGNNDSTNNALSVLRYVVEDLLRWSPKTMVESFDQEVITRMKLEQVIQVLEKKFPVQLDSKKDFYWYAKLLYPDVIKIEDEDLTIKTYRDVLTGKLKKFPKGFLEGDNGEERIKLCLLYYLEQDPFFTGTLTPEKGQDTELMTIRELYRMFAKEGNKKLKAIKLDHGRRAHFPHAIDFLHVSLPSKQRNDFFYYYYKFKHYNTTSKDKAKKIERTEKKERKAIKAAEENE